MATLNIKPNIPDKDIPDYIYTEDIKQTQPLYQQQIQQIQQQQQQQQPLYLHPQPPIQQMPQDTMDYLANQIYVQKLQKDLKNTMTQNLIKNTFG